MIESERSVHTCLSEESDPQRCYACREARPAEQDRTIARLQSELATALARVGELRSGILIYRQGCIDANKPNETKLADLLLSFDPVKPTKEELSRSFSEMLYANKGIREEAEAIYEALATNDAISTKGPKL